MGNAVLADRLTPTRLQLNLWYSKAGGVESVWNQQDMLHIIFFREKIIGRNSNNYDCQSDGNAHNWTPLELSKNILRVLGARALLTAIFLQGTG